MIILGINEKDLQSLATDIMRLSDEINLILNKYDNKFFSLQSCYEGKSYNELKNYYASVREKYSTVKKNLVTYSDDFIALIRKMKEADKKIAGMFNEYTAETKAKTNKINDTIVGGK